MRAEYKKGSTEWQIIADFWKLWQKYGVSESKENDKYWDALVREVMAFPEKYDYDSEFLAELAVALTRHLERNAPSK